MQSLWFKYYLIKTYIKQRILNFFYKDVLEHRAYFAYKDTMKNGYVSRDLEELSRGNYMRWTGKKQTADYVSIKRDLSKNGKLPEVYFADDEFYQAVGNDAIRRHPKLNEDTSVHWEDYAMLYHYKELDEDDL